MSILIFVASYGCDCYILVKILLRW